VGYKLSAAILNRKKAPGKVTDGLALFFKRNNDGTLSAIQHIKCDGKESDVTLATINGDITQERLQQIRADAYALKVSDGKTPKVLTFEDAWNKFYKAVTTTQNSKWLDATAKQIEARVINHVSPTALWSMPVGEIRSSDVEAALAPVKSTTPKNAPRVLAVISQVISYAAHDLKLEINPAKVLREKIKVSEKPVKFDRLPAITDWDGLGRLLSKIKTSSLYPSTRWALTLQAYTAQRSGEVALARWKDFDLEQGVWTLPRADMKVSDAEKKPHDHRLLLPPVVVDFLRTIPKDSDWLFPPRHGESDHITIEAFSQAFQRLGFRGVAVPHGWRSSLKTLTIDAVDEDGRPLFAERWVEDVLDHSVKGVEAHYTRDRAEQGMGRVLAWWAENLERACKKANDVKKPGI
jgi:integrase